MPAVDEGLLTPVAADADAEVTDAAVASALVAAEVALSRAWAAVGAAPDAAVSAISEALGWAGPGSGCDTAWLSVPRLAAASVAGGNPVIPLVGMLKDRVPVEARAWVHRGATSQDVLDSALMLVARRAGREALQTLRRTESLLAGFAVVHRDEVAAARTLTQHAVPTTIGARAASWLRGVTRARVRLAEAVGQLPAQLGGAGGTLAAFVEIGGPEAAASLPVAYAAELGLAAPAAPWHVTRWPVTELGDALVQAIDAAGKVAADVATLSRTEIGELAEGAGGGSSAMPQKQNPTASVLLRSAALRAPQLGATLHLAGGFRGRRAPGRRLARRVADAARAPAAHTRRDRHAPPARRGTPRGCRRRRLRRGAHRRAHRVRAALDRADARARHGRGDPHRGRRGRRRGSRGARARVARGGRRPGAGRRAPRRRRRGAPGPRRLHGPRGAPRRPRRGRRAGGRRRSRPPRRRRPRARIPRARIPRRPVHNSGRTGRGGARGPADGDSA
ncbi:lyase family protein [Microbacterium sp. SORGH_AS_0888]|uniref:lyase family protein n=1 Tax=Microbacterium sp. SORGH_AS_0888 TaxID=3041791 RepID=UPI00277F5239|nr:lyase family protein [Microbacterium sp. SORGH_AS_0888]MDQ1129615.1 adenylosuccinate lyase [Microbacterium sp. SORGH_AS_0888]